MGGIIMELDKMLKNKIVFPLSLIVTMLGNITFNFSTNLYLLEKTEKGIILATNISLSILPVIIFAPILGKVIDNSSHKKLIILFGNFLNLLLMLLMILFWNKLNNTYLIYFGILFNNFFSFLVYLTFEASIPQLFPRDWLIKANSLSSSIDSISGVLSPLLGGFIYSILEIQSILKLNIICISIVILINTFLSFRKKSIIDDNFETRSNLNTASKNKKILQELFLILDLD
jgi:DHA3 family macrolide efflux protein-like MFS transporter